MDFEVIKSPDTLDRLRPEWNELVSTSEMDTPFLQWDWCSTWWRHYGGGNELAIVVARDADRLVGLAPLYLERGADTQAPGVLKFLGTGEVCSEYLGFVLRSGSEEAATRGMLNFLFRTSCLEWQEMRLTHMPERSAAASILEWNLQIAQRSYRTQRGATSWSIALEPTWEGFLAKLSRSRRDKLRRAKRDMERCDLDFYEVTHEEELDAAWTDLTRLHQARWERAGKDGCFASSRFAAFHTELLRSLWQRGMITLTSLRYHDRPIAASYCMRHRGRVYFYQAGTDPDWRHCRPGHCLRMCELQRAIQRGDRVFDFLGGDEEYKCQWATQHMRSMAFMIAGAGLVPRVRLGWQRARHWAKESARARLSSNMWGRLRNWRNCLFEKRLGTAPRGTGEPGYGSAD